MGKIEKKFGKRLPFEVPVGYFEELSGDIMESVRSACPQDFKEQNVKYGKIGLYLHRCLPYISMAAIISFVVVMMQLFVVKGYDNGVAESTIAELETEGKINVTDEEIIEYLSSSVYDVESFLASMQ